MASGQGVFLTCVAALWAAGALPAAGPNAESLPDIIETARRGAPIERLEAIDALAAVRDRESLRQWRVAGVLLEISRDRNPNFARPALRGLLGLCRFDASLKYEALDPVAGILRDGGRHNVVRIEAATGLGELVVAGELRDRSALDALTASARPSETDPPEVASACLRALGRIGDPRAREVVREALAGGRVKDQRARREIRAAALDAFAETLRGPGAKEWLDPALAARLLDILGERDLPPATLVKAIRVAGLLPALGVAVPGLGKRLLGLLNETAEPDVAIAAMRAHVSMPSEGAAGALATAYARFDREAGAGSAAVRASACEISGELLAAWSGLARIPAGPPTELVRLLVRAVADTDRDVVASAVVALGNLYDARYDRTCAAEALVAMLGARGVDERTRRLVLASLEVVTGRVLGDDAARWEEWLEGNMALLKPGS